MLRIPTSHCVACSLFLVLTGCATEPKTILTGDFGGRLLEVTATSSSATFRFACGSANTTPITIDGHRVSAFGNYSSYSAGFGPAQVSVVGIQSGDTLTLTTTISPSSGAITASHTVVRGALADFSGIGCLATTGGSMHTQAWAPPN